MTNPTPPGEALRAQQDDAYDHGPQAETVEEAARDVGKWLNERPNRPLDLRHVAMLTHHAKRTAHVQNPAEIEHVAGDVSKNGVKTNTTTAQSVAQQGAGDGFFLLLPQRPKPEAPAGTAGLDWDAYSGAQMLAFGRDCSDAAIAALRTQQTAPATQQAGEVRRAELVPGVMHCAKCKFQLNRVTLCVSDGNAYAGNNKTEPCPNGCGPLWPVTWEQEAKNCWKALEEMHERLMAAAAPQSSPAAQAASSTVLKAIREANMQLVRTGDDAFMLVPYKVATAQAAESVPAVSDLPPLPDPDLRDVGTKPQDVKDPGFTAADMATASAQGFRDGVASIAANAEGPVVNRATVIEWLDANDIEVTDRQLGGLFHFSAPPTAQAEGWTKTEPLIARSRGEWHEDDGPVVWWSWNGHGWAGESPWCGTPLDSDWPGYHTHWTPAPPAPTSAEGVEHG